MIDFEEAKELLKQSIDEAEDFSDIIDSFFNKIYELDEDFREIWSICKEMLDQGCSQAEIDQRIEEHYSNSE